jgi:Transglycosylase SLT domain
LVVLLLAQQLGYAAKASVKPKHPTTVVTGKHVPANKHVPEKKPVSVQIVSFPDTGWQAVKVIRGGTSAKDETAGMVPADKTETAEVVTFDDPNSKPVRVMRGDTDRPARPANRLSSETKTELVTFADPRDRPVTVLRGSIAQSLPGIELLRPASESDLDRVAFAVDGAESSHGADLRMWRPELNGPQGPMQVSAAAAIDIGGGNRFDMAENRQLGRAYLAHMYRRYGNWPDAITAYNWGPGNMDAWISAGRPIDSFPLEVERYRDRVMRDARFDGTSGTRLFYDTRQFPELVSPSARQYPTVGPSPAAPARRAAKAEAKGQLIRP